MNLSNKKLVTFFVDHLDKIYCAKLHLINNLPSLLNQISFPDLKDALKQTIDHVKMEISRMDMIYALMGLSYSGCSAKGLIGFVDDAFIAISNHNHDVMSKELSVLFYLQNIESVEMASFQILQVAAVKLKNKHIVNLLAENYSEAKADRTLLLLIAGKYLISDLE